MLLLRVNANLDAAMQEAEERGDQTDVGRTWVEFISE